MELVQTGSGSSGRGVGGGGFRCMCISPLENPVFWILCFFASPWVVYAYIAGSVWDHRFSRSWINSGERHHPISLDLVQGGSLSSVWQKSASPLSLQMWVGLVDLRFFVFFDKKEKLLVF